MMGTSSFFTLLKDWVEWSGHAEILPMTLVATGLGDTSGRVLAGLVSWLTSKKVSVTLPLSLTYILLVITLVLASFAKTQAPVICSAYGLGLSAGSQIVLDALASTNKEDPRDVGAILFFGGLGALAGPPLAGYLVDHLGYTFALQTMAVFPAVGAFACMICFVLTVNPTLCSSNQVKS